MPETLVNKVRLTIKRYQLLAPGETVLVGVSGGADSVCLLHVLYQLSQVWAIKVVAAHLNHLIRGQEAERDQQLVLELGQKLGIPVQVGRVDVPRLRAESGVSLEEAARQARYQFLEATAAKVQAAKIAVAHHANDQAETVLMHLIRGGGTEGLRGMAPRRGRIIRPLLEVTRPEIEQYCREHGLPFIQDSTNFDVAYLRNRIRWQLLPWLAQNFNPAIVPALNRTATILAAEDDWMEEQAEAALSKLGELPVNRRQLALLPEALERRVIRRLYARQASWERGHKPSLDFEHVEMVRYLIRQDESGTIKLPGKMEARTSGDRLYIRAEKDDEQVEEISPPQKIFHFLGLKGRTNVPELGIMVAVDIFQRQAPAPVEKEIVSAPPERAYVDLDLVELPLWVRTWEPGDWMCPLGMGGRRKKVQDLFVDVKIPSEKRLQIPIIASAQGIIWVGGVRLDDRWKVTPDTSRVLQLELLKCDNLQAREAGGPTEGNNG